jgi:putative NIF3 family GTP cyclohydrolase 1 type 2
MTATRAVLAKAVALRANLIVAHEPTFFQDGALDQLADDPVYRDKRAFLEANRLVVWRCHDSSHQAKPDVIVAGMTEALGWDKHRTRRDRRIFDLPATTLGKLVAGVKKSLKLPAVRVTGDPKLPVRRVALSVGCPGWNAQRRLLREPGVDAILCGEVREWETCEYARDAAATAHPQGLIVLGHLNSEEPGMAYLARLVKKWFPRIPVHFVPAGDPFWPG